MRSYETCIWEILEGETPKQKYDSLINILGKIENLKVFFISLQDTPDDAILKNLRSITDSYAQTIGIQSKPTQP